MVIDTLELPYGVGKTTEGLYSSYKKPFPMENNSTDHMPPRVDGKYLAYYEQVFAQGVYPVLDDRKIAR